MKVIDAVRAQGGTIKSFSSVCGGLASPDALEADNPLQYKFSWSPRGVISAAQNASRFLENGEEVSIPGSGLLGAARPFLGWPTLNLEVLPNRDSLIYKDLYGIQQAEVIVNPKSRSERKRVLGVGRADCAGGGAGWCAVGCSACAHCYPCRRPVSDLGLKRLANCILSLRSPITHSITPVF